MRRRRRRRRRTTTTRRRTSPLREVLHHQGVAHPVAVRAVRRERPQNRIQNAIVKQKMWMRKKDAAEVWLTIL